MQNRRRGGPRPAGPNPLVRAIRYLGQQRRTAIIAYSALVIATLAQVVVPELVRRMITAVTSGTIANSILNLPPLVRGAAATRMGRSLDELRIDQASAESLLLSAVA